MSENRRVGDIAFQRVAIIGGGVVGLATACRIQEAYPAAKVTVYEKEAAVGQHQTGHNSGVLHCGLYYKPGSLKAKLAVSGIRQMVEFCQANGVPHEICGKLVVAASEDEVSRLKNLQERGLQNGLEGLRWLSPAEMKEIEPNVGGVAGLHVPQEGIVDYRAVCDAMVRAFERCGGSVVTGAKVTALRAAGAAWRIQTTKGEFEADFLVNCAGLYCDRVSEMAGERLNLKIIPFRGEYYKIRPDRQYLVRHLIYPVPDPAFPFLGVHFTRLIHGGVEAGPNAVLALAREGYRKTDIRLSELMESITFPGLWRFLNKHQKMCWEEVLRSFSRRLFCQSLQRLVPEIREEDLVPGGSGVRAQAMMVNGELVQDFCFIRRANALHVLNAPSPAATASLAIGKEIARMLVES